MKMYSLFDRVTHTYSLPFFAINDDDAKRKVVSAYLNQPYFASDLQLFGVAEFFEDSGNVAPFNFPTLPSDFKVDTSVFFTPIFIAEVADLLKGGSNA